MFCQIEAESAKATGKKINTLLKTYRVAKIVKAPKDEDFWLEVAQSVGQMLPMEENAEGNKTGRLFTDIKFPWHEESQSFSYSNTRQPLHTDGSYEANAPQITFFSCLEAPKFGGATIFIEMEHLVELIKFYNPVLLKSLYEDPVTHRKGKDFKTRPIIYNGKLTWNYYRCEDCCLRQTFHDFLEQYVVGSGSYESVKLEPGQALFFMDEMLLHGRLSFLGNRWLLKGGICV